MRQILSYQIYSNIFYGICSKCINYGINPVWILNILVRYFTHLEQKQRLMSYYLYIPVDIFLFKVNNEIKQKKPRTMCEICSHQWSRSGVFIVNFKQIWHIFTFFWLIVDLEQVNVDWHQLLKKCPFSESFWRPCRLCIFENHGRRTE